MRTIPKIKRVHLKVNQGNESVFLGIVSAEPDYKLSLALNQNLKFSLRNKQPLTVFDDSGNETEFSRFSGTSDTKNLACDLTSNRSGKQYLVRKLKNIDYILRIHDPDNEIDIDKTVSIIRDIECITAVFNIDPGTIDRKSVV